MEAITKRTRVPGRSGAKSVNQNRPDFRPASQPPEVQPPTEPQGPAGPQSPSGPKEPPSVFPTMPSPQPAQNPRPAAVNERKQTNQNVR